MDERGVVRLIVRRSRAGTISSRSRSPRSTITVGSRIQVERRLATLIRKLPEVLPPQQREAIGGLIVGASSRWRA